jgi:hypothetical protein
VDCLTVGQRYHPQYARHILAGLDDLTPEADPTVGLYFATKRLGNNTGAPGRINIGPLA